MSNCLILCRRSRPSTTGSVSSRSGVMKDIDALSQSTRFANDDEWCFRE